MEIFSNAAVVDSEKKVVDGGSYSSLALMDRVIERMWRALQQSPEMRDWKPSRVVVFAGRGKNAGYAIGLASRFRGCAITLCVAEELRFLYPEAEAQLGRISVGGYSVRNVNPKPEPDLLIIDGLLGSGAQGELEEKYAQKVKELNKLRAESPHSLTISIDVPTGLDAETGKVGDAVVRADLTLPIAAVRPGLLSDAALDYVGGMICIPLPEIELLSEPTSPYEVLDEGTVRGWRPTRVHSTHKYRVGSVTVIAGSPGMLGAAQMCAEAALVAGSGLVTLYCPESVYPILATRVMPEVMVRPLRKGMKAEDLLPKKSSHPRVDTLVAGPGMGGDLSDEEKTLLKGLLEDLLNSWPSDGCVVLDAWALTTAFKEKWKLPEKLILTPHLGEMEQIFPRAKCLKCHRMIVEEFMDTYDGTLLLKGGRSIVAHGRYRYYNSTGGSWMAGPGFGDVLAGVVGALAAQGLLPMEAAALGAFACGQAATDAWRMAGFPPAVRATSTLTCLPGRLS